MRRPALIASLIVAVVFMPGAAAAESECRGYVASIQLTEADMGPHVSRYYGGVGIIGVYIPAGDERMAVVFIVTGEFRVYRLTSNRWYDPNSGQFVCR